MLVILITALLLLLPASSSPVKVLSTTTTKYFKVGIPEFNVRNLSVCKSAVFIASSVDEIKK